MNKKTPQKKICRSYATCPDHTCDSCNANPYNSATGATTLDGSGNPIPASTTPVPHFKGVITEKCRYENNSGICTTGQTSNCGKECIGCYLYEPKKATKPDAITPELLPPETNALTHSRTNELPQTYTPGQVTEQWGRARTAQWHAINESLKLGAMLIDVEKSLVRETHKGGCFQTGDTLKAWLETNCPEVNYKTALRYRNAAEGLARQLGRANKVDGVQILIEADCREGCTPEAIQAHSIVEKAIDGRSMNQLLLDLWGEEAKPQGGSREGSGRPVKSAEEKLDLDGEIARKIILGNIDPLREEVLHRRGWMRISDDRLETMRTLLKEVVTKMSDELERRGRAKKFGR